MSLPSPPRKFTANQKNFATSIATDLWQHAAQMLEYINGSYPLGMLIFVYKSQPGMPANSPDPAHWHYMDGSVVDNPNSPFDGMTFPDLRGKFVRPRCTTLSETQAQITGSDTMNLGHSHGGLTGSATDATVFLLQSGGALGAAIGFHTHSLSTENATVVNIVPPTVELQVYMRIA